MNIDLDALERIDFNDVIHSWEERDIRAAIAELRASREVVAAAREWVDAAELPMTRPLGDRDYGYQIAGAYVAVKKALEKLAEVISNGE